MSQIIASSTNNHQVWDIHGGVHPAENKQQSVQTPIQQASIPDELIFPLSQHIGAPAEAIVAVGDKVLKGQMIAKASGFVSVPIHASTSGEVIAIENRPIIHSSGMTAPCIVIKSDGEDKWCERPQITDHYATLDKTTLIDTIRNAGIAGMGGAGFPAAVKLNTPADKVIETLIINGTECEPYITADDMLMRERAEQIIEGALILNHIINPTKETLIGVEDNKPEGIAALKKAAKGTCVEIVSFPTKYPSGGEKQLIQILTGKEVPSGGLPADIGVVCQNIGTTVAIYNAVTLGEPLISRITTVTGNAVDKQQNYEVLLGTPVKHLLQESNYQPNKAARLIIGGPMMGFAIDSTDVPVIKSSNCILTPTENELPSPPPAQACIRCGMCSEACPASLLPQQLYWFAQSKNHDGLQAHHLFDCIECGACSFVCPSNIPLVQYYRASKAEIKQAELNHKKAEYSRERFEARQERLAKIEAAKEAKRKERQEKAAKANSAKVAQTTTPKEEADKLAIQAALERTKAKKAVVSDDPVQAAIDRAQAKAGNTSPADPVEEAKAKIESLEKRLKKAEDKLATARENNDENLAIFESSAEKLRVKLEEARADQSPESELPASDDPVQAAIARAKAKRTGGDTDEDPKEKLEKSIISLEKRLATSKEKLEVAEKDSSETVDAFRISIEKLNEKLNKAKAELAAMSNVTHQETTTAAPASDDPVQAAIERAKAKRDGSGDELDPKAKLEKDLASLEKRIEKTTEKLHTAEEEGLDTADILKSSLEKLQDKQTKAQAELEQLG